MMISEQLGIDDILLSVQPHTGEEQNIKVLMEERIVQMRSGKSNCFNQRISTIINQSNSYKYPRFYSTVVFVFYNFLKLLHLS
jgi:hypothetical protein